MITRDEEGKLPQCLASVAGVVDEICILDTGSTDATVAVARRHGARIAHRPWDDDFAAARNASLALATGDWILILDADETLAGDDAGARLRAFATTNPDHAGHLTIRDREVPGTNGEVLTFATRFFSATATPVFVGRIHEQLQLHGAVPRRAHTGVDLLHHGYSADALNEKDKYRRNLRLLRAELEQQPESPFLCYQLGLTHMVAGAKAAALQSLTAALGFAAGTEPYIAHLAESLGYTLRGLDQHAAGLELIAELRSVFATRPDTVFLHALLCMDLGQLAAAEAGFLHCLSLIGRQPRGGAFSPTATTSAPAHNLGVLYEVTGDLRRSQHYYRMALAFDAAHSESLEGLARLRQLLEQHHGRTTLELAAPGTGRR